MKKRFITQGLLALILVAFAFTSANAQCCVAPAYLTVTSISKNDADVKWKRLKQTSCTTPVKYTVRYRVLNTTTWTTINVKTQKDDKAGDTTLLGLTPSTTYQWQVRGKCSSTSTTPWVTGLNFTTLAFRLSGLDGDPTLLVSIYPNPATSTLTVNGSITNPGTLSIQLTDLLGKSLLNKSQSFDAGSFSQQIDVSDLPAGYYMLRVQANNEAVVSKFIKQ